MKVSDYIALELGARGVTHAFEVVGGMITHLIDSVERFGRTKLVSMHHEQGAAFAVDGAARTLGRPYVAFATSGPGATNLLTGIASCYFDSVPAVFITGQVNTHELRGDSGVRQLGFQETDIVTMVQPIVKGAWMVRSAEELPDVLDRAFWLAAEGRPGPTLVDIPMNIQQSRITVTARSRDGAKPPAKVELEAAWAALARASRPLAVLGGGIRGSATARQTRNFLETIMLPAVHSLLAVDTLPSDHPLRAGFLGSYGNRWANLAVGRSDLLLVLGSRLDIRQTGADTQFFAAGREIVHVDVDAAEINGRVKGCIPVQADLRAFFESAASPPPAGGNRSQWLEEIAALRARWPHDRELDYLGKEVVNPNVFMAALGRASGDASAFSVDVGQHQMWAAQSLYLRDGQQFITSGGMGAMGYALPAAIGASLALGSRPVVVIAGDGGFQLNIQELQTVVRERLPIKMVVLNNQAHGMVRQFQESYFGGNYRSTVVGYSAPDFAAVATAYGIEAAHVRTAAEVQDGLAALWQDPGSPFLLEVAVDQRANVYPKIAFGHPLTEMEPFVKPMGMEGT